MRLAAATALIRASSYNKAKQRLDSNAGACRLIIRQFQSSIKIIASRTTFQLRCNDRLHAVQSGPGARSGWEGRQEHLFRLIYLGSFAARTSTFSMDGGAERSSDAFSINAAATLPER